MIAWARRQNLIDKAYEGVMYQDIQECWTGSSCVYCDEFAFTPTPCEECPIAKIDMPCSDDGSIWKDMVGYITWREWIIAAEKMLKLIKGL